MSPYPPACADSLTGILQVNQAQAKKLVSVWKRLNPGKQSRSTNRNIVNNGFKETTDNLVVALRCEYLLTVFGVDVWAPDSGVPMETLKHAGLLNRNVRIRVCAAFPQSNTFEHFFNRRVTPTQPRWHALEVSKNPPGLAATAGSSIESANWPSPGASPGKIASAVLGASSEGASLAISMP